jgi:hypothetical protein
MRVRLLLFTVATTLIVGAPATAATLPHRTLVGPAQGVQASLSGKRVTVRFTGASAAWGKKRAGQAAAVSCEATPGPSLLFRGDTRASGLGGNDTGFGDGSSSEDLDLEDLGITKLSPSGASVSVKVRDIADTDLCEVRTGLASSADSAWAALTPRGTIALEEQQRGLRMTDVAYAAAPKSTYRAAADVVALGGGEVVALDDPNGTPPAGKIGYWSKGRAVSLISASATGRRLELQDLGGGMLRTNAFEALMSWTPAEKPKRRAGADDLAIDEDAEKEAERYEAGEGVYSHLEGGDVVFRFTGKAAKAYRRIAGRRVAVMCMKAPERPLLGGALEVGGMPSVARVRVPAHGGTIRAKAPAGRNDLCAVTYEGHEVAFGLLTPAGRRYLVDFIVPLALLFDDQTPWDIAPAQATRYPGVATVLAAHPGVVGLPTQGAALAVGKTGVWTDADQQASIVFSGPDGLRYVLADEGDGVVRTNLFTTFLSVIASAGSVLAGSSAG